jgi:hypothetical protein
MITCKQYVEYKPQICKQRRVLKLATCKNIFLLFQAAITINDFEMIKEILLSGKLVPLWDNIQKRQLLLLIIKKSNTKTLGLLTCRLSIFLFDIRVLNCEIINTMIEYDRGDYIEYMTDSVFAEYIKCDYRSYMKYACIKGASRVVTVLLKFLGNYNYDKVTLFSFYKEWINLSLHAGFLDIVKILIKSEYFNFETMITELLSYNNNDLTTLLLDHLGY